MTFSNFPRARRVLAPVHILWSTNHYPASAHITGKTSVIVREGEMSEDLSLVCHIGDTVHMYMQVCKEDVDDHTARNVLVPCQVSVRWVGDEPLKPLLHKIHLSGAKKPRDFLTVTSPKHCIGRFMQLHVCAHVYKYVYILCEAPVV